MLVDDVGHDRGAEHADGQEHAVRALEAWDQPSGEAAGVDAGAAEVVGEAEEHDPEQAGEGDLEAPVAAGLVREDRVGDRGRHEAGDEWRHSEQKVECDRGTDELG